MKNVLLHALSSEVGKRWELALKQRGYQIFTTHTLEHFEQLFQTPNPVSFAVTQSLKHVEILKQSLKGSIRWVVVGPLQIKKNSILSSRELSRKSRIIGVYDLDVSDQEIDHLLSSVEKYIEDPFFELMHTLEFITGVQISKEKKNLVDSRLSKRVMHLGHSSLKEYADYFFSHINEELQEAISLITTHTTEFFREKDHFDFLIDKVFPKLYAENKSITLWSAAASTGQEAYSLAICLLEYFENVPREQRLDIKIIGTDIDSRCLQIAREGIYTIEQVANLPQYLVQKYFDVGRDELKNLVRVKNFVHHLCEFSRLNLIDDDFPFAEVSCVFLRNTMIYFETSDISKVVHKISSVLDKDGQLFLGHSESLSGITTPFESCGSSIYKLKSDEQEIKMPTMQQISNPQKKEAKANSQSIIAIGSSTGGVEALQTLLETFPVTFPPVLIVQHIPKTFSHTLASRLSSECNIPVNEATSGEVLKDSHVYIAPGGKQMRLVYKNDQFVIEITSDPPVRQHRPSVDYLFDSITKLLANPAISQRLTVSAALLTGMGKDGAEGLKKLRNAGAYTIAQNQETSVVFGMPAAAIELGAAQDILSLNAITSHLLRPRKNKKAS